MIESTTVPRLIRKYTAETSTVSKESSVYLCVDKDGFDFYHVTCTGSNGSDFDVLYELDDAIKFAKEWL